MPESPLDEVNLQDTRITELEAVALAKMLSKREQYVREGRGREAHGLGTGIVIMWRTITDGREYITNWSSL